MSKTPGTSKSKGKQRATKKTLSDSVPPEFDQHCEWPYFVFGLLLTLSNAFRTASLQGGQKYLSLYADIEDEELSDYQPRSSHGGSQPATSPLSVSSESSLSQLTTTPLPPATKETEDLKISDGEFFLERYIKQPRSKSDKVAYVVFNGPFPGVYYNW